jgi:murein DD-endopeptidase MepM/ murein hydrolase activator NlpD
MSTTRLLATAAAVLAALAGIGAATAAPPGYERSEQRLLAESRAVAALVRAEEAERLVERFTPQLAAALPLARVRQLLEDATRTTPIGNRAAESAFPLSPDLRGYTAEHVWGTRRLTLSLVLDEAGRVGGFELAPRRALPRDPHAGRRLQARLTLPFRGTWWVWWGGPTERQNYHVVVPDQRHAYDFAVWRFGATHRGSGARNADYWAWNSPLLAPAAGVVVEAVDGFRDNRPQVQAQNRRAPAGNHVVLDLGHGEYAVLAHMKRGSVRVRPGQRVRVGDVLGRVGNSGNSSEPHLHLHVQDRPELGRRARGLPLAFTGYRADGRAVSRGTPVQGQFVASGTRG